MKAALVDVPVKINVWIRTECQRKQFEVIKKARPSILFIQSDGGRNEKEWEAIYRNRKMIDEGIDWNCQVFRLYETENNGLYKMSNKSSELIWNTVDKCIFLEDDHIPAVSFFRFCKEMLDKYEDDYRIQGICGYNPLEKWEEASADYFFSGERNPWGNAYWKRSRALIFDFEMAFSEDKYVLQLMKKHLGRYTYTRAYKCGKSKEIDGHVPGGEFFFGIARATQNALFIMPKYNMISNYGCGDDSIHSSSYKVLSKNEQKLFYSKVYEMAAEIQHPKYVIRDVIFEKKLKKAIAVGHPLIKTERRVVKGIKTIRYQGIRGLLNKMERLKKNRKEN